MMTIPGTLGRRSEHQIDPQIVRRTMQNRANEKPSQISLLRKVEPGRDLRSIGVIGPGLFQKVRHGSDLCGWREGLKWQSRMGEGGPGKGGGLYGMR